jgi:hypothetical protein
MSVIMSLTLLLESKSNLFNKNHLKKMKMSIFTYISLIYNLI